MSKIGRKPIDVGGVQIEIEGQEIRYKGKKGSGIHSLPIILKAELVDKKLMIVPVVKRAELNEQWGLHRALLANAIKGVDVGFEKQLKIVGLGYKAAIAGSKLTLSLGYSHKVEFDLPAGVTVEIDKTGQLLTFKSTNKELLGEVCSKVRSAREPEPYKKTGIQYVDEVIIGKAGKAKSA